MSAAAAVLVLVAVLGFAVARPRGLPEAVAAVPAALLVAVIGLVSWRDAAAEVADLAPTVAFLAAVLVLAHLADSAGVFSYAGAVAAGYSRGSPRRLLGVLFVVASAVTVALSLDATVVLLTPVVLATATRIGARPKPHLYACTHLANSASLLLPVSNLTNLLAYGASGLGFLTFAGLMAVPSVLVVLVEYLIFRRFFAADLATPAQPVAARDAVPVPRFALAVLAATLAGFAVAEPVGIHPAWVAAAGAVVLAVAGLFGRTGGRTLRSTAGEARELVRAANPPFLAFVAALGVVVLAVRTGPVGDAVGTLVPGDAGIVGLLLTAVLAAVLANLVNNLPATLMLVPLVAHSPGLVLAVLLGVNIGPNLTYTGSLATLLWRQILHRSEHPPSVVEFLRLGAVTVPACLVVAVAALWAGLRFSHV